MGSAAIVVELVLLGVLGATLFYAVRLHRALGELRREGGALTEAAAGFESGVSEAGAGLERLRDAAQGLAAQLGQAAALKDDLVFLSQRGGQLADRLDVLVRAGQALPARPEAPQARTEAPVRSQAERNLVLALRGVR